MLLILANFSLFWFSQPWTLPASIYSLTVCSQNELSSSSSKDKSLFPHQSLTLILGLCRALTQTKVHSEMSTPVHALKFHIWLFHTESAEFLHVSLPPPSSQSWQSQLLGVQSTAEPVTWWLPVFNAWTLLVALPLPISIVFLPSQKKGLQHAPSPFLAHHVSACCHSGIWNLDVRLMHVRSKPPWVIKHGPVFPLLWFSEIFLSDQSTTNIVLQFQLFFQRLLLPSEIVKRGISFFLYYLYITSTHYLFCILCPLEAGNSTLLVSDSLHVFPYKSVEFNNCIMNLCHVSEVTLILPLMVLPWIVIF